MHRNMDNSDDLHQHPGMIVGSTSSYFHRARNVNMTNTNFTNIQGDYYQISGLTSLERHISHGAMFDSAARYPAGECHPGTRTRIIKIIRSWIDDPNPKHGVLWVHGSAGVGKSALMQTLARLLHQENMGRYAGSFFFANGVAERNDAAYLFPTLAYQIAVNLPSMRPLIEAALNRDITLPTKAIPTQVQALLVEPFKLSHTNFSQHTPTVIIDGLDECTGSPNQTQILLCIANALSSGLPIRFLIASRPERWIKSSFSRDPLLSQAESLSLNDRYLSQDSYADIQRYLEAGFADIYALNSDIIGHSNVSWPSYEVINKLVNDASGQFIYASTVLKFVGHSGDFYNPRDQLAILLKEVSDTSVARVSPFSEIDKLYMRILSTYPRPEPLKKVLGGLMLALERPVVLAALLGVNLDEVYMILNFLSSVLKIEETPTLSDMGTDILAVLFPRGSQTNVSILHKSFSDFLHDKERSGEFSVDAYHLGEQIIKAFLESTVSCMRSGDFGPHEMYYNHRETYDGLADMSWIFQRSYWDSIAKLLTLLSDLYDLLQKFVSTNPYNSGPAVVRRPDILLCSLDCILNLINGHDIPFQSGLVSLLEDRFFPRAVEQMIDSGYLPIDENLVMTSSLHNPTFTPDKYLPWLSPEALRLLPRGSKGLPSTPWIIALLNNESLEFHIDHRITDSLKCLIKTDHQERYRSVYTHTCHFDLAYLTNQSPADQCYRHPNPVSSVFSRLQYFFDSPFLSDITGDIYQESAPTEFVSVIVMALELKWAQYKVHQMTLSVGLSCSLWKWRHRQMNIPGLIETLKLQNPILEQKLQGLPERLFETVIFPAVSLEPTESTFPELIEVPISSDGRVDPLYSNGLKSTSPCNVSSYFASVDYSDILQYLPDSLGTLIINRLIEAYLNVLAHDLFHRHLLKEFRRPHLNHTSQRQIPFAIRMHMDLFSRAEQILRPLRMIWCWSKNYVFDNGFGDLVTCILDKLERQKPQVVSPTEMLQLRDWAICLKEYNKYGGYDPHALTVQTTSQVWFNVSTPIDSLIPTLADVDQSDEET